MTLIRHPPLAGDTFPQREGENVVYFRAIYNQKDADAYSFLGKRKHKILAFPAGEGADQLLRREADEGGSCHRLFRQTTDRKTAI